eukprot:TRINITY_DN67070_c8_g4_i1.p1 TRINITY_DN67070_c8_g4~~TRINITY_DN67070_c8_g4_i1.p1  ORF type:complete len:139 (+),score=16.09 TRINITY_DN67070_c8_g4_i1:41-457(+)
MAANLKTEVLFTTANDDRHPATNIIDGDEKTFWITSGMFPHEILIAFKGQAVNISKIRTWSFHVKKFIVEKCTDTHPVKFERFIDTELGDKNGAMQIESFQVSANQGGGVRFIKICLASGWDDFASVHNVIVEGEEVP